MRHGDSRQRHHKQKQILIPKIFTFTALLSLQIIQQKQRTQAYRMQSKFHRHRNLQAEHAVDQICIIQIQCQKHHQHKYRRISPAEHLPEKQIDRYQKDGHMNSLQKQQNTVYPDSKQHVHTINKAMHRLRIYAVCKNITFDQAVYPFMMGIQIPISIRVHLKCTVREICHPVNEHDRKNPISPEQRTDPSYKIPDSRFQPQSGLRPVTGLYLFQKVNTQESYRPLHIFITHYKKKKEDYQFSVFSH